MKINLNGGSLVWLRRDLRLDDNSAINNSLQFNQQIAICFVFDKAILSPLINSPWNVKDSRSYIKDRRVGFIHSTIAELQNSLINLGSHLFSFHDYALEIVPWFAKEINARRVICSSDYEPETIKRDKLIQEKLNVYKIDFIQIKDQCIFEKNEILTSAQKPYTIFTPYKKKWIEKIKKNPCTQNNYKENDLSKFLIKVNSQNRPLIPKMESMGFSKNSLEDFKLLIGSNGASKQLNEFKLRLPNYGDRRNFPSQKGVSYLSVHFRFGTISIRKALITAFNLIEEFNHSKEKQKNIEIWISELIWRDFYMQILYNFPHVSTGCFKKEYDCIEWNNDEELFYKWTKGNTGFPIVDAGMRQLNKTGYMHNRLRMITACFLTKDLGINWQLGENYFSHKLNDFDLSANNGGWQWSASTGCDAQPYFRIFNPTTQSKNFDPEGIFIKKYIPELTEVQKKQIHEPHSNSSLNLEKQHSKNTINYPKPIVEHAKARIKTLERFKKAREMSKV